MPLLLLLLALGGDVAFVDVAVVPMDEERVLEHRTVVVRDGRIASIGEGKPPDGATVIDGRGRFLMPGLADMHVHAWYEEELTLFVANGVTTVRNLWGKPMHLRWREEIERGARLGPTFFTTGDILDGSPPVWQGSTGIATADEARETVAKEARQGFPELKLYNGLAAEVYDALIEEARRRGLRVTGHVPTAVGIDRALGRQDCIEHLDGYFGVPGRWDPTRARELAAKTAEKGTWNCPTLVVYDRFVPAEEAPALRARFEMRYVPPRLFATWDPARDFRLKDMTVEDRVRLVKWNAKRAELVRMLRDAGARLLLGTDSGNPFVVAGWSAHDELALLVGAGLTPFEALSAGTRNAAEYLRDDAGTVEVGKRADLLLLAGNPLEDVRHAAKPLGVMARGRWLPAEELARMLEEVLASYKAPKDRFRGVPELPGEVLGFEVLWNDVVVGEERYSVVDGTIRVQVVNDPPWSSRLATAFPLEREGDVLRTSGTLASWAPAYPLFEPLAPGRSVRLDHEEGGVRGTLVVERSPDADGARVFDCVLTTRDGERTFTIWFGKDGLPCGFLEEMQQGIVRYLRVSHAPSAGGK